MNEDWLRQAVPPMHQVELRRDLWPAMLQRMTTSERRLGWIDWVAAGVTGAWLAAFPEVILALLYHL